MLSALASGTLVRAPKSGTSASGTRWANTTIRCSTGTDKEGAALTSFVSVICFGDTADTLAKLAQGDSISVQGALKQTEYTKDGETRHGLEIMAQGILTPYALKQKRGDQGKANVNHGLHSDREQAKAYGEFARRATAPAHDGFADEQIPF
jgi:single-stranded DNA-binding protein